MTTPNNAAALERLDALLARLDGQLNSSKADFYYPIVVGYCDELKNIRATLTHDASGADWHWLRTDDWSEIVQAMPLGDDRYATGYQDAMNAVTRKLCSLPRPVINPAQPDALTSQPSGEAVAFARVHDRANPHYGDVVLPDSQEAEMWAYDLIPLYLHPSADAPVVAVDWLSTADFMKAVSIELMLTFADDSASAGKAYMAISKVTAALAPKPEGGHG